jgi:hypothetical protein
MGYILKNTSGLINTVLTDAGRQAMSKGLFDIAYFQVGDSEVCYDCVDGDISTFNVLQAEYNVQNNTPVPQKNKSEIKYPLFVDSNSGSTVGIPFQNSQVDDIYNSASPLGFFTGNSGSFSAFTTSAYTYSSSWRANLSTFASGNTFAASYSACNTFSANTQPGDFCVIYMDGNGACGSWTGNFPILFYQVVAITGSTTATTGTINVQVDRNIPNFNAMGISGNARVYFFPSGMTPFYDAVTPSYYWPTDAFNFESNCDVSSDYVKIWNMNIPWTESPAGYAYPDLDYNYFKSSGYCGTKEYLGYNSNSGQVDTSSTYYYNTFAEKINLSPSNQKAIAIIHYTNHDIDNYYGEKFATEIFDPTASGATGQLGNFRLDLPWLMWHKSTGSTMGQSFFTDPRGFDSLDLDEVQYIQSRVNSNQVDPGLRYYHLWDTNPNSNGYPNRVGKVWPDLKIITIDDDELVASMSYKSNRNWTLPAPTLGLITPNTFNNTAGSDIGVLSGTGQTMWVTYMFTNTAFTQSLHCNYYTSISGTNPDCPPDTADITIRFAGEFPFLKSSAAGGLSGFTANNMKVLAQLVTGSTRPNPANWLEIDVTNQISATSVNGYITFSGLTGTTIQLTNNMYTGATDYYRLENYIDLPQTGDTQMNFGSEYFFYGSLKTDIQATIYEMQYMVNLGQTQFSHSSNPTWNGTYTPYVTEIGLYNSNKDIMIISKVQSPEIRQGVQQYKIKLDF